MATARQKILRQLEKVQSASARELARALNLSTPDVRQHLALMCADGRVQLLGPRRRGGRGRPEKIFALSEAALGDNLASLADALLAAAAAHLDVQAIAARLLEPNEFIGLPASKRLPILIERLNRMRYRSRWEASGDGPRVIFARCPYAKIIAAHPELCEMDTALVGSALGSANQIARNAPAGGTCVFATRG